ncbi:hypothetical protein, partial [Pseudomonas putida]|uniref:hypothetical protein n=1 Tax=Pseudomonas putida TaxID=303 RepID=UPI001E523DC0
RPPPMLHQRAHNALPSQNSFPLMVGDCTEPGLFRGHISVSWDFRQSLARLGQKAETGLTQKSPELSGL